MTGGQALIRSLEREGVRVVFGLPGAGQYEAIDALYETPGVRYISTRHEQATSFMADAYARASGRIAAVIVVPGPGLYNAFAGIATAYAASSPMLVISGARIPPHAENEADEMAWIRPLTKWTARARSPAEVPALVHEAMRQLKTGRPRPVYLEVPHAVLAASADVELRAAEAYEPPAGSPEQIERAAQLLATARRPVIWAGGGVHLSGASAALQRLAEHLQAPVVTGRSGKGALSDRHPLSLGLAELQYVPLREWLQQRDLLLVVGARANLSAFKQPVIRIDIDDAAIRPAENILGIAGDARRALEALYDAVAAIPSSRPSVADEVRAINAARFDPAIQLQPQWDLMRAVRAALPDDGILIQGMNQMGYYSRNYYPVYAPRTYLTASSYATLGSAFPLALGAKIAWPDRAVVALSGDGGFLYNSQELATAVQEGIHAVVVVFNDNAYGNVLRAQLQGFDGHVLGTRLHNPDFVSLARSYGARGVRAENAAQLEPALRVALATDAPTLIEVPVGMLDRQY